MRVSRERGAPACPVNINLSAQWSYHEETRKKFRCSTDGGCIVIPRAPAQQRPFVQCSVAGCCCCCCRCRGAMNESVVLTLKKEERHNIKSSRRMSIRSAKLPPLPPSFLLEKRDFNPFINRRTRLTLPVHPPGDILTKLTVSRDR